MYIACDDVCWKISSNIFQQILDLQSDHEEADAHCLLHAKNAANEGLTSALIICEDTDVMIVLRNAADIGSQMFTKGEPLITPEAYILMKSESL